MNEEPQKQKTFECVICKKTVTKRKSYAFKNGRACKTHQQAVEAKDFAQEKKCQRKEDQKRRIEERKARKQHEFDVLVDPIKRAQEHEEINEEKETRCWCCFKKGVAYRTFLLRRLFHAEVCEEKGAKFNPLFPTKDDPVVERLRKEFGSKPIILPIEIVGHPKAHELVSNVHAGRHTQVFVLSAQLLGQFYACPACVAKHDLKVRSPKITLEGLQLSMAAYAVMKPERQAAARAVIATEN